MLTTLAIANYRSLRSLAISLKRLNIVSGPRFRKSAMLVQGSGPSLRVTDDDGHLQLVPGQLLSRCWYTSVFCHLI